MKKSWKKLVCGLLCAALLWGSLPLQASAAWFSDTQRADSACSNALSS